ncbi:MAG TPA: hypothetical protein VFH73_28930 [Polyangia bacterium]|jgi:hypothetical protein|nr:hypothetical protein [Polyangia bacterium]
MRNRSRLFVVAVAVVVTLIGCDLPPSPDSGPITPEWSALTSSLLVPRASVWRYSDTGTDLGSGWRQPSFNDTAWKSGAAQLGYGDGDEATVVSYGPSASNKYITTYFRRTFTVTDPARYGGVTLRLLRDDGAIAYLNGTEVFRTNMPAGAVDARTLAPVATPDETTYFEVAVSPALLRTGTNTLAVEVHQSWPTSSDISFDAELAGTVADTPPPPMPTRARVTSYLINYGPWTTDSVAVAKRHQLVIAHPRYGLLTRALVAEIQRGVDAANPADDVKVLCYISVGEDSRSAHVTDTEARTDPRFIGDGTGPRIDPRGPDADGKSLAGIDPRGIPSNGGTGFASFYLDDNSVDRNGVGDGIPDRNAIFGSYFVNAGDPKWFAVIDAMTLDGGDGAAGFREMLTTQTGRGLGCDGVFLDTLDTAAPNHYTDRNSFNQSEFEWTAPGYSMFMRNVRAAYPGKLIVQNRGLFFLDPRHPQYQFTTRGSIDFVLFESYRLNSNTSEEWDPYFYPDNRFNIAPKLMAEATRADGFQVLSLGYAEGPSDRMSKQTLIGQSTLGYDSLLEDIRVTQELAGLRHYLTDARVTLVNTFVLDHGRRDDPVAPIWTSTFNDHQPGWPNPPGEPTPRIGIQKVAAGSRQLVVSWDVAMDGNPVSYAAYLRTTPFDFSADPTLRNATRVSLSPRAPANYIGWGGPGIVANEATVANLVAGQVYYVVIRASDESPSRNEDGNTVVLSGTPGP